MTGRLLPVTALLVAVMLPGAIAAGAGEPPRDPEAVRRQLQELRERMAEVQEQLFAETRRRDAMVADLAESERRLNRIAGELRELDSRLADMGERLDSLQARRGRLLAELDAQRGALSASVRSAFLMGREQRIKMLLNQEDAAAAGRVMAYYRYLHEARVARINQVRDNLAELRELESQIAEQRRALDAARDERAAELAQEKQAQGERRELLAAIRSRIESKGEKLTVLQRDERTLEELLRSIEEALADIPARPETPFASLKGKLAWPVPGVRDVHTEERGLLIEADAGAPVRAVAPGRVAYADWLRGYGLLLILDHGDGFMSLYAHNHSLYKSVGDWVAAGDPVGEVGASGGRERAGLYFELRRNGEPIGALAWLGGRQ